MRVYRVANLIVEGKCLLCGGPEDPDMPGECEDANGDCLAFSACSLFGEIHEKGISIEEAAENYGYNPEEQAVLIEKWGQLKGSLTYRMVEIPDPSLPPEARRGLEAMLEAAGPDATFETLNEAIERVTATRTPDQITLRETLEAIAAVRKERESR